MLTTLAMPGAPLAGAQEVLGSQKVIAGPILTGSVVATDPANALMVVQPTETQGPITFHGMDKARIETSTGRLATFAEVQPKMPVTVYYAPIEGRWYVGRVLIPDTQAVAAPSTALTTAEQRALRSKAANDADITTEPGVKARIDNDITTKPGTKDARDPDITKKTDR